MTTCSPEVGARITALLTAFKLPTPPRSSFAASLRRACDPSLPLLCEVLELEAGERRERRVDRLRRASKLPPGKTSTRSSSSGFPALSS